jgi:hypothetical protein
MRKIVSFSLFNKILEGEQTYEELVPEFSEYNSILSTFLNTTTSILTRTKGIDREELASLVDDIKSVPLEGKANALIKVFDGVVKYENPDLDPAVKSKLNEIQAEIKKIEPLLSELIAQEEDVEVKEKLLDFISKWCDKNGDVILKPEDVKESLRIFESIKLDPRNMFNVFSSDVSNLLTQANAVKTDIDALYDNPTSVRLKRSIEPYKRKINLLVDELQTGNGQGVNWSILNRPQAKERIAFIQNAIRDIVNDYTEISFKETAYDGRIKPIMTKLKSITDRINLLLSDLLRIEKEIEEEKAISSSMEESNLDWSMKTDFDQIIGQRKGKWYVPAFVGGNLTLQESSISFGPDDLLKGDTSSYKLENSKWYTVKGDLVDFDSKEWAEITDPESIKILNNAYAYHLIKVVEWCLDNKKSFLYDKSGNPVMTNEEYEKCKATLAVAKNFDPIAASKRVKGKAGYDEFNYGNGTGSEAQETNDDKSGSDGSDGSSNNTNPAKKEEKTVTGETISKELPGLTFKIGDSILTNENENKKWQKSGKDLTTTWFTPGTFSTPDSIKASGSSLGGYWIRLASGYWEMYKGANKPADGDSKISKIKDLQIKGNENVDLFKNIVTSLNSQLERILKDLKDLIRYWGVGSGKTNISDTAWGSEKEARAIIKGGGTKDERIEVEIWPDKLGGSSISDDVILKVYKNGGLGIMDDDYADNIWGSWKVDDDGDNFIVNWEMYSDGDSSYNKGWKPISNYSGGRIGAITKFTGPVSGGLKPVLDDAMRRFIQVFY